jgi:hypothetical protein
MPLEALEAAYVPPVRIILLKYCYPSVRANLFGNSLIVTFVK